VELLDGNICAEGITKDICYADITSSSEDQSAIISCTSFPPSELYSQTIANESVAASDAVTRTNDGVLRSSSYEDIYVGTKLPGDEHPEDDDGILDVSEVGDRFDSRPAATVFLRQSRRKSSSFENLYEIQKKEAVFAEEVNGMDGENFCTNQWQIKDSSEDVSEKDSTLAPFPSLNAQARRNSPIDITVESGLDRVGQTAEYSSRNTTKRSSSNVLQHSMSYDVEPGRTHRMLGSGSSLDGDDDAEDDFLRGRNTTSGIRNGCCCTCCNVSVAAFGVVF